MKKKQHQYLSDPEYLFSLLAILVKKNGGKLTISEEDMKNVSTGDLIGMYYESGTNNIILKEVDQKDMLQATSIIHEKEDEVYEN